ncbi:Aspartic protease pep1 like protein [Zymoseptoria brevis]|uniref:Aspartic protease pep1 like protein n=1 Tax=Zymoseptoria brevis TaxID=1047168 RepID=A0A0F4GVN7_9PEZI|nr:Aspartic protease pep1 like protein [Zymoseptoria brevis]
MHNILVTSALVASATLTMAGPAGFPGTKTFQVAQVPAGQVLKSGPIQMAKTYGKYSKHGAKAPADVSRAAAAATQSGSVKASPEQFDQSYLCPVTVGGQTLNLDFDTGSADLWVYSNSQPSSQQTGHSVYTPGSTAKRLSGQTWKISYGDGSGASGIVYSDKVVVGGVTATGQAVEAAQTVSDEFVQDVDNDGLLGLAFSSINTVSPTQQKTFFDTVKSSLAKQLFTCDLKAGRAGTYDFGYIDASKHTGTITYVSVDSSQGFWTFNAGGYSAGSAAVSGSIGSAIADTGTSLVYLPTDVVTAYYSKLSGAAYDSNQGGYTFPCSRSPPNFNVKIGAQTFTIPGSYIKYAPVDSSGTTCFGGIQRNTGIGLTIFGDVFLKAVFAVFDVSTGSPRLGLAPQ